MPTSNLNVTFDYAILIAQNEYLNILRDRWANTVMGKGESRFYVCLACSDDINVLGYPTSAIALSRGVSQQELEEMTSSQQLCGYLDCECRYHLGCLLKLIRTGLGQREWRCKWHQAMKTKFYVADTCGFPVKIYNINQISDNIIGAANWRALDKGLKRHLSLVQTVCQDYKIQFCSVMLSLQNNIGHLIPYDVKTVLEIEQEIANF